MSFQQRLSSRLINGLMTLPSSLRRANKLVKKLRRMPILLKIFERGFTRRKLL
jgi:hypothetical protein